MAILALCYHHLQDFGAFEAYKKSLAINPDYLEAHINLGSAFKEPGKLEEALEAYNKALAIKPDNAGAYYNLGAFQEQGKLEEAIVAYQKVNDKRSTAKALECTYFTENYDDFSVHLNSISEKDPTNIRVAAMSAFAAQQQKKEDPYPFCPNPIELIKFSHNQKIIFLTIIILFLVFLMK